MITILLDMLASNEFYGVSENIEIAKGKNKLPTSFKYAWRQRKRKIKWRLLRR